MSVNLGVTATIGIRGTNVAGELIGESATVVLLEPEGDQTYTAIDVYNDYGTVTIDEPSYGTEIANARSAPSAVRRMKLNVVTNIMRTIPAMNRIRINLP